MAASTHFEEVEVELDENQYGNIKSQLEQIDLTVHQKNVMSQGIDSKALGWRVLALYAALTSHNQMVWITFSPIKDKTLKFFDIDDDIVLVDFASTIYMFIYLICFIPAYWGLESYGLRRSLLFAAALNCGGTFIRYLGSTGGSFGVVLLGQSFCAVCQCIQFAMPSSLARIWFPADIVSTVVGLAWASTYFGMAMGLLVPPLWLGDFADPPIPGLMFGYFLSALGIFAALYLLYPANEPMEHVRTRASSSEDIHALGTTLRAVLKKKDFLRIMVWFGIMIGAGYAHSTDLQSIYGHMAGDNAIGFLGFFQTLCGVAGVYIGGRLSGRFPRRKLHLNVAFYTLAAISLGITSASVGSQNFAAASFFSCLFFFGCIAMNSTALEYATEVNEGSGLTPFITSSLMMGSVQLFGIILTFGLGSILEGVDKLSYRDALTRANNGMILLIVFVVAGWVLLLYIAFWDVIVAVDRGGAMDPSGGMHHAILNEYDDGADISRPLSANMHDSEKYTDEEIMAKGFDEDHLETDEI
jgi:MFS family permease